MQFKYNFTKSDTDKIPFVDVIVGNPNNGVKISYRVLLDSGAYMCVFHTDIAKVLRIDLSKIQYTDVFYGVEKSKRGMRGKRYIVDLMLVQKGQSHKFQSYVVFSDEILANGYGLLGRQGFFDSFDEVSFNYKSNKFYLKKN